MGRIIYPIYEMENNPAMFETTNQLYIYIHTYIVLLQIACVYLCMYHII